MAPAAKPCKQADFRFKVWNGSITCCGNVIKR